MRIAYLLSQYPYVRHPYLMREVRELRRLGFEIEAIAIRADERSAGQLTAIEREEADRTHYILGSRTSEIARAHFETLLRRPAGYLKGLICALRYGQFHPVKTLSGFFYFAEAVAAGWWMTRRGLAHVHTHYASTVAWMMAATFPITVSMTIHGSAEFDEPGQFRLGDKIRCSVFVRAISCFGRSQLMRAAPYEAWNRIEVCPLGIDPAGFTPADRADHEGPFELLSVGGMAKPKAFEILIESVAELIAEGLNIRLRLVGDGPDRARLEQLARQTGIANHVIFEGWKNQDQLPGFYAKADGFVLSSLAEGVPVVLMEAMATGLPCVATRITGIPELIRDGVDGLLVTVADTDDMVRALRLLAHDPELRRRIGASARARVVERFNIATNAAALARMFERHVPR